MRADEFAGEMEYLGDLYTTFALSERMAAEWFARLEEFDVTYLHEAIGCWLEQSSHEKPSLTSLLRLTDVASRAAARRRATEARKAELEQLERVPVEERAAFEALHVRQLLVHCWPEYRHLWPDVTPLGIEA